MKKLTLALFLGFSLTALPAADHAYEGIASPHDLMDYVVKRPAGRHHQGRRAAIGERLEARESHASILAETSQLLLMAGRIKDDVWEKGAHQVMKGAKASLTAAEALDVNAWRTAAGSIGKGCRGCHKVHKPKKEE